jgi:cyclopropane fatty-acyl-phospholipid synthase-like methyltransferase
VYTPVLISSYLMLLRFNRPKAVVPLPELPTLPITAENAEAVAYVGTKAKEGLAQLQTLLVNGCLPSHRVLEIGCGALIAGFPVMQYLEADRYVGIDPNKWLIDSSLKHKEVQEVVRSKNAQFLFNEDFDGSSLGSYDFILSHSILSHAAFWQLELFLDNAWKQLNRGGKAVASLRLTEPNKFGSKGSREADRDFLDWVYPGNSYFNRQTVVAEGEKRGFRVRFDPELTRIITSTNPASFHDWAVFERG